MRRRTLLVVIGPLFASSMAAAQVAGTVIDEGAQPVVGARVSVQASALETTTDANGNFDIPGATGEVIVVVGHKGYFNAAATAIAPATALTLQVEPVPLEDDINYEFASASQCVACHAQQVSDWVASPMAHGGVNTWVYDLYDGTGTVGGNGGFVYLNDSVHAGAAPESECRSCHQPEGWARQPFSAMAPLTAPENELNGVTCEICHKARDIDVSKPNFPGFYPGVVTMTRPSTPGWTVMYGALGDVSFNQPGLMRASYNPQLPSELCATCHQDKNDHDLDGDFEDEGGVISEPTYIEWRDSAYGDPNDANHKSCVDCHMPPTNAADGCGVNSPSLNRPAGDIRSHDIRGTTPDFLDNAVTMKLQVVESNGEIEAQVAIANDQTGHHVPSGVTIRNMILVVEATTQGGDSLEHTGTQAVHELGGIGDPSLGYYGGLPGKLYAKINHDESGSGPTFFTDAVGILSDTRIPALETDVTSYTFATPAEGGNLQVRARLIYRRSWRALTDAKGWTEDGHGSPLEDMSPPHYGHLMEEAAVTVTVGSNCTEEPCEPECSADSDCAMGWLCIDSVCEAQNEPEPQIEAPAADDGCDCRQAGALSPDETGFPYWLLGVSLFAWRRRRAARAVGSR